MRSKKTRLNTRRGETHSHLQQLSSIPTDRSAFPLQREIPHLPSRESRSGSHGVTLGDFLEKESLTLTERTFESEPRTQHG